MQSKTKMRKFLRPDRDNAACRHLGGLNRLQSFDMRLHSLHDPYQRIAFKPHRSRSNARCLTVMVKPRDQLGCRVRMKHDTDECVAVSGVATKRVYIAAAETIDLQYDLGCVPP
jgi:hypothetical protein